jgi:hypothetical protein
MSDGRIEPLTHFDAKGIDEGAELGGFDGLGVHELLLRGGRLRTHASAQTPTATQDEAHEGGGGPGCCGG